MAANDPTTRVDIVDEATWNKVLEAAENPLPAPKAADKGKYLHANESTGAVEWADAPDELPAVSAVDEGKVLTVNNSGVWGASEPIGKKFIVTLTPTALDYSGTMDKTVAEIDAAYKAGREIWFRVMTSATTYSEVALTNVAKGAETYPSYNGYIIDEVTNVLIFAHTNMTNDGTKATYSTTIYTLTPAT